jgi:tRNA dimethylallyltransferase
MKSTVKPTALLLMGPTASGKTALAITLAQVLNAEIISVDSALVYRGMDIGTAKPTVAERSGIVHHLIDILDPSEVFSTGQFRQRALELMRSIVDRDKLPLLVGGTMLYFNALIQGLAQLPSADPLIRQRLDKELQELGKQAMHDRLALVDPAAASRIHINDPQRIQRALEVYEISGRPISSFFQENDMESEFELIKMIIAPQKRQVLHDKIAQRFKLMLASGFLDEVRTLQQCPDLHPGLPSIRCVGYRQAWSYLNGEYDLQTMQEKAIVATRQLAKRQFTWLRKQENACQLNSDDPNLLESALQFYRQQTVS